MYIQDEFSCDEDCAQSSEEDECSDSSDGDDDIEEEPQIDCDCADKVSPDMRNFVISDDRCEHWANSTYRPPAKLQDLMSERERKSLHTSTEETKAKTPPQRRMVKSFQQRLAEQGTRKKRLAMAKEAHRWYKYQASLKSERSGAKPTISQVTTPTPSARDRFPKKSHSTQSRPPSSHGKSSMSQALRQTSPDTHSGHSIEACLRAVGFVTSKKRGEDCMSQRSGGSEMRQQRMFDAIQWDSE